MAEEHLPFRVLMARVREGSHDAAVELQRTYGDHIVRAVRRRLPRQLRPKFDSVDFVQDVWASFFRGPHGDFVSADHLIAFLTRVARNKVVDATRQRLYSHKHDVNRERPLAPQTAGQEEQKLFAREATPSEAAIGRELWEQMLAGQPPAYRLALGLLRDGMTQEQVAAELKLSRKTVQRILNRALTKVRP
jgi:RNA polymerase sigma-70 factor (ECF subfamily)